MRSIYTLILVAVVAASCQKEAQQTARAFSLWSIQRQLKDSMRSGDFARLDFSGALYNHVDSAGLYFIRVPFRGSSIAENFVLVKLNEGGSINEGRIIQLNGGVSGVGNDEPARAGEWEGEISISPLNRGRVLKSDIHNGYIEAFHRNLNTREMLLGANVLPEVVVVAYVNRIEPMDMSTTETHIEPGFDKPAPQSLQLSNHFYADLSKLYDAGQLFKKLITKNFIKNYNLPLSN